MAPNKAPHHDQVTNAVILDALNALREDLRAMALDLKTTTGAVSTLGARVSSIETENEKSAEVTARWMNQTWPTHDAHHVATEKETDGRLTSLEKFQARVGVYLVMAGSLGAAAVGVVLHLLKLAG